MSGKGELVRYRRFFEQGPHKPDHPPGPLTPEQKKLLKDKVTHLIDSATVAITIEIMIAPSPVHLKEELEKYGGG